jgi:protein SCO1/2
MVQHARLYLILLLLLLLSGNTGGMLYAQDEAVEVEEVEQPTGVVEKGGDFLPLDAVFQNENGEDVTLGQLIDKPTLVLPVYFNCPRVCSFDMANLAMAMQQTSLDANSFNIITFSFDDTETPKDSAKAKKNYTHMLKGEFSTDSWYFLTGDMHNIQQVTGSIGYTFKSSGDGLFIHPSALVAVGRDGKIIKYVYGAFLPGDVDLAIAEAEKGTPTTSIRRFLAYCLSGDPERNRSIFRIMKISVMVLIGVGGFFLVRTLRKDRQ